MSPAGTMSSLSPAITSLTRIGLSPRLCGQGLARSRPFACTFRLIPPRCSGDADDRRDRTSGALSPSQVRLPTQSLRRVDRARLA
eukprot:6462422-Amphidinium_carterae.1